MKHKSTISRRELTRKLGLGMGLCLLTPRITLAGMVTPSQVEGPFYPNVAQADTDLDMCMIQGHSKAATGEQILVQGKVFDTDGNPLANATVDVWQANHYGRYSHTDDPNTAPLDPDFQGWGIVKTNAQGIYRFKTIKPGSYPLSFLGEDGHRCRHIHFKVSHPEHQALTTQMYFEGDPLIAQDLEIAKVPEDQRHLLIASAVVDEASQLPRYQFDLCLGSQGV